MTFELTRLRLHLRAAARLPFPPGKAANVLRGAFGILLRDSAPAADYHRIFEPPASGPSGLAQPPRPFVFRAAHLDGRTLAPGDDFHFDVHLFDPTLAPHFESAFALWRERAELSSVKAAPVTIDFAAPPASAHRVLVRFVTPTELKPPAEPTFPVLFARLRDRISTLRSLYGPGPLDIDFRVMAERAALVRTTRCDLVWQTAQRRSSRTGQTHPIGGFTGEAEYDGDLGEFLPYLRAGYWTGVGRQTVWGKGEICFQRCS